MTPLAHGQALLPEPPSVGLGRTNPPSWPTVNGRSGQPPFDQPLLDDLGCAGED
jgi:hypothetical protein